MAHRTTPSLAERIGEALRRDDFILLVLSRPLSPSATTHKVTVRPVLLREGVRFQWTVRQGTQERHENLTPEALVERADRAFGTAFGDAHLYTSRGDFTGRALGSGHVRWKTKPPSKTAAGPAAHNREKNYLIPAGQPCPFLSEIGVMTAGGQIRASMAAKFRQINRYLEFIEDVVPELPPQGTIRAVDFGCGKSYLTFALHHLLTVVHGRAVHITGLDLKDDVIAHCSAVARRLNCAGLEFRAGDIAGFHPDGPVHLAISLHACDTATDDALAAAIGWGCRAILAVPCCQQELHRQLRADAAPGLTDYGLFRERLAAMATDALRAQFLEASGYKTQVLEFIELEHTPKNVLLRAVRRITRDAAAESAARDKIARLKRLLGVSTWRLEEQAAIAPQCERNP
jgi:hypothetical protein